MKYNNLILFLMFFSKKVILYEKSALFNRNYP